MMAPSVEKYPPGLKFAVTLVLISSLITFLPSKSVGLQMSQQMKMVLGSRPPGCVNKCMSCRPCMAILVIPSSPDHHQNKLIGSSESVSHREDDPYYLLSWKCRCDNKLYQP